MGIPTNTVPGAIVICGSMIGAATASIRRLIGSRQIRSHAGDVGFEVVVITGLRDRGCGSVFHFGCGSGEGGGGMQVMVVADAGDRPDFADVAW